MTPVCVQNLTFSNSRPFVLMAGPCVIESRDLIFEVAGQLCEITKELGIGFVFKASFDKANRTSVSGHRGVGIDKGLWLLEDVKKTYKVPIVTDVHLPSHCKEVAEVADILQIPAFLCRQTDLIQAAAETGRVLNIKKGQFLAPWDMRAVLEKARSFEAKDVLLCERGTCFGYNTLVSDMRALPEMESLGAPVIFDATHSVQQPGGQGHASGGQRAYVETLARAAMGVGIAGIFMETHPDPDKAFSDGPNMVPLAHMRSLLKTLQDYDRLAKSLAYQPFSAQSAFKK